MTQGTDIDPGRGIRRFARMPYECELRYRHEPGEQGMAACQDLGRGGMRIELGRYLRPGRQLIIETAIKWRADRAIELKCEIAWCRQREDTQGFAAGVRFIYDEPTVHEDVSELVFDAAIGGADPARARPDEEARDCAADHTPAMRPFFAGMTLHNQVLAAANSGA